MSDLERIGKHPLTLLWRIRKHLMHLWEIDLEALASVVPAPLECVEVRPGRALLAMEAIEYNADHFRPGYREFLEIVLAAVVQPDLSLDMPMPRYCMYAISVYSDSPEFCDQEHRVLFTPTELVPKLRCEFSPDGASCDVYDGDAPIALMKNTSAELSFDHKALYGQYYTHTRGFEQGIWRWDGHMAEHQKPGDYGTLHSHAFWKGIDLARVRGNYRQMIAKPDTGSTARFYHVGPKR